MAVEQPFSDEEIKRLAEFASISEEKVRGIAWLTTLKLLNDFQGFDRSAAHNDGRVDRG
jgi:hypothetical protein